MRSVVRCAAGLMAWRLEERFPFSILFNLVEVRGVSRLERAASVAIASRVLVQSVGSTGCSDVFSLPIVG